LGSAKGCMPWLPGSVSPWRQWRFFSPPASIRSWSNPSDGSTWPAKRPGQRHFLPNCPGRSPVRNSASSASPPGNWRAIPRTGANSRRVPSFPAFSSGLRNPSVNFPRLPSAWCKSPRGDTIQSGIQNRSGQVPPSRRRDWPEATSLSSLLRGVRHARPPLILKFGRGSALVLSFYLGR